MLDRGAFMGQGNFAETVRLTVAMDVLRLPYNDCEPERLDDMRERACDIISEVLGNGNDNDG